MKKKQIHIILFLFLTGLFLSCKRNGTNWDTRWAAPLTYGELGIEDLVQDSVFSVNPDSTLQLIYTTKIIDVEFDSIFKVPDTTITEKIAPSINLEVSPGTSFLNQVDEREFDIDNAQIKEMGVKSGGAHIEILNPIETGVYLTITLPGVQKQGVDLQVTAFVEAGTQGNPTYFDMDVDFEGYLMDLRGSDGNSWNTLTSVFEVQSDPDGDTVLVTNLDSIQIDVTFQDLLPNYGRGYFGNRTIASLDTVNLDFMKKFVGGNFLVDSVNLNLNLVNGVVVIATGVVNQLTSINSTNNNIVGLNHPIIGQNININPASGAWNTLTPFIYPINIHSGNSNIQPFLENLPDQLVLDYDIEINPLGNISGGNDFFYPLSEMAVELELDMPTRFSVDHLKFIDTFDLEINQDPTSTNITDGELTLNADNYFPFGLDVELIFLDEMGFPLDTLFSDGKLNAGIPDINGKVLNPTNSEIIYLVDQNFMNVIENAKSVMIWADLDNQNHPLAYDIYNYYTIGFKLKASIGLNIQF